MLAGAAVRLPVCVAPPVRKELFTCTGLVSAMTCFSSAVCVVAAGGEELFTGFTGLVGRHLDALTHVYCHTLKN